MSELSEVEREQFVANLKQNLGYKISPVIAEVLCGHVETIIAARERALREEIALLLVSHAVTAGAHGGDPETDMASATYAHAALIARQARP